MGWRSRPHLVDTNPQHLSLAIVPSSIRILILSKDLALDERVLLDTNHLENIVGAKKELRQGYDGIGNNNSSDKSYLSSLPNQKN